MSLSSLFARLISPLTHKRNTDKRRKKQSPLSAERKTFSWWRLIIRLIILITLILSAVWLLMAIWYQFGAHSVTTWLASLAIISLLALLLTVSYLPKLVNNSSLTVNQSRKWKAGLSIGYTSVWLVGLGWFFSIEAKRDRNWQPEVSQVMSYSRDANNPNLITFTNVRNFDWYISHKDEEISANERWETRTVDMSKLSGVDIINSYWMGPLIAHTLVSFRFENERPLSFSFEIRKEDDEKFSALAGFFRRFELSLIAAEERDIIYTRSNARGEQVYLFPVSHLQQSEVKSLFESYLTAADELNAEPAWYNTLTSNCTNIIFYMARIVSGERLPWDYRIWVSGWLPNYLYDIGMLDGNTKEQGQPWSMDTWYERTHINSKVRGFNNQSSVDIAENGRKFSEQIRQGLPIPPLADSQLEAESRAQSAAKVSNE